MNGSSSGPSVSPRDSSSAPIVADGRTEFERDSAVEPLGDGRYRARMSPAWWIVMGPNGGYVAAVVLRAAVTEVGDDARRPLSATFHYLRPPAEGDVELEVTVERSGRSVTNVSVRMTQDDRLLVLALVALGTRRPGGLEFDEIGSTSASGPPVRPDGTRVPHWSELPARPVDPERDIAMRSRYDMRWGFGAVPFSGEPGSTADTGGWLRLKESPPVDEMVLVAMADAWMPPVFSRTDHQLAVPTVDLTVHFRGRPSDPPGPSGLAGPAEGPDSAWCFVRFASPVARAGYLVEHGSVWDSTGRLLADVRQLAVVL